MAQSHRNYLKFFVYLSCTINLASYETVMPSDWHLQAKCGSSGVRSTRKVRGLGRSPRRFLETTPFRCSENEGNALFSYILHFMHVMVQTLQIVLMRLFQQWQQTGIPIVSGMFKLR